MKVAILPYPSPPAAATQSFSWRLALLFVAVAATAVIFPMLLLGNASGHDFQFHVASWMDVTLQWREGIIYPRWAQWANWGFGEPRFVFYPPASWMIGAVLSFLAPWRLVPGIYIWLTLIAAGMSMWKLTRDWLTGPDAAATAVFFAVNPYNLVIVYYRSDFGELLAGALFPLLLWATLHVASEGWSCVPILSLVFGAIWLCDAPAAVIATYSLVLFACVVCVHGRSVRSLAPTGTAMATGFGIAAFYIVPALYEQRWVQITRAISPVVRPEHNFLFTHANEPDFLLFNWKVSGVALGMMLVTGVAAVFAARRRREMPELWRVLFTLGVVSVFMMFRPSALLWRDLPELVFVQFPWRWLEPLALVFAFFVGVAISLCRQRWASHLVIAMVLAAIGLTGALIARDAWWSTTDLPVVAEAIRSGHGYDGTNEFAPIGCNRYKLPGATEDSDEVSMAPPTPPIAKFDRKSRKIVPLDDVRLDIQQWSAERKIFSAETTVPVTLALRLVNYPAWQVRMDNRKVSAVSATQTAQILLPLTQGTHHIEIFFRRTWDRTTGDAISSLSAIVLLLFAWVTLRRKSLA